MTGRRTGNNSHQASSGGLGPHFLDMLGQNFSLGFPTTTGKYQTSLGGYLTVFMGLFSLSAFAVIFSQLFDTQSPVVTSSLEFGHKIMEHNLFHEGLFTPISLADGGRFLTPLHRKYVTLKLQITIFENNEGSGGPRLRLHKLLDFIPCTELTDPVVVAKAKEVLPTPDYFKFSLCPDFKNDLT